VVSAGGGGEYDVTPKFSAKFDIGDRFEAKPTWRCIAAWWHVSDTLEGLSAFHQIDVSPRAGGGDPSDIDLTVVALKEGKLQIAVTAAYENGG
jgi:hypothetical protein